MVLLLEPSLLGVLSVQPGVILARLRRLGRGERGQSGPLRGGGLLLHPTLLGEGSGFHDYLRQADLGSAASRGPAPRPGASPA